MTKSKFMVSLVAHPSLHVTRNIFERNLRFYRDERNISCMCDPRASNRSHRRLFRSTTAASVRGIGAWKVDTARHCVYYLSPAFILRVDRADARD